MKMHVLNGEKNKRILLLHPMLSSAEGIQSIIVEPLGAEYTYLLPDLSGHGEAKEQTYISAKKEAQAIYDYLKHEQITSIDLAVSASLGSVVLFELLAYKDIRIKQVVCEGTSFHTKSGIMEIGFRKAFLSKHKQAIKDRGLSIRKLADIYGEKLGALMADCFINLSEESIRNIVHDCTNVHLPDLAIAEQENCTFTYGSKDYNLKKAKKVLPQQYPHAELIVWDGYEHCAKLTNDTADFCALLKRKLGN